MDIYSMTRPALADWFRERGENPAKADILFRMLYQRGISDFRELPFSQRVISQLSESFTAVLPETVAESDGGSTKKLLLRLSDGEFVETVLMRQHYGGSVCISTQVGCAMGCAFCQSGRLKKRRSLTAGEMTAQVLKIQREYGAAVHSVTVMGIGEPFDNFSAVTEACGIFSDDLAFGLGVKHVTVSTCGIVPEIRRWAELSHPCSLAVSLHAADDGLRSQLMPINRKYPVAEVVRAAADFADKHNRRVTLEYIMLDGVNDSPEQAAQLAQLIGFSDRFYVNIIPYNGNDSGFRRSSPERIAAFYDVLKRAGTAVTMRREFGGGIAAACGQLSSEHSAN